MNKVIFKYALGAAAAVVATLGVTQGAAQAAAPALPVVGMVDATKLPVANVVPVGTVSGLLPVGA